MAHLQASRFDIRVLGGFRVERRRVAIEPGQRTLDVLRVLAVVRGHSCALADLHEWLWPDADGDRAKAACDQAVHRLRAGLGLPGAVWQRAGRLGLEPAFVAVDLDGWDAAASRALQVGAAGAEAAMQRAIEGFVGPLLGAGPVPAWAVRAAERVRETFLELVARLGRRREAHGDTAGARHLYRLGLDHYPTSERCYAGLIRTRLTEGDASAAFDDYRSCARVLAAAGEIAPSPALGALLAPFVPRSARAG